MYEFTQYNPWYSKISNSTKQYGVPDIVQFLTDSLEFSTDLLNRISSLTFIFIFLKVSYSQNLILILNIDLKTILFWCNCFYPYKFWFNYEKKRTFIIENELKKGSTKLVLSGDPLYLNQICGRFRREKYLMILDKIFQKTATVVEKVEKSFAPSSLLTPSHINPKSF